LVGVDYVVVIFHMLRVVIVVCAGISDVGSGVGYIAGGVDVVDVDAVVGSWWWCCRYSLCSWSYVL